MRGKSFGSELEACVCLCVCTFAITHIWMVCGCPPVPGLHLWESGAGGEFEILEGTAGGEGERERGGADGWGSGAAEQSCAEEECNDCFHVWGGQESRVGCRQVRLAPNEKSCVGDGGGPRHGSPVAARSQS